MAFVALKELMSIFVLHRTRGGNSEDEESEDEFGAPLISCRSVSGDNWASQILLTLLSPQAAGD
jgi:hypothetical protein